MAQIWPAAVPYKPLADSMKVPEPFIPPDRTDMEDGKPRSRRAATKNIAKIQFTIRMTAAEFVILKAWIRDVLVDGTLPFEMPIWTGAAYETRLCEFAEPYQGDPRDGVSNDVAVTLDVEDY